ncbi:hypothetical protein DRH29_03935 [candidate division Kazan bacterium]|uniref:Uncharacterized protein n=1 Tax=candidate division Kazan bacterium TaxID=2202143 RepID=A0A420ZBR3_UNCK3|nr:MAG: hypothetical protein DRH29_03935 [candidate division Kazan bacterium]
MSEEPLPISEKLKVLQAINLYKTEKWWSAVTLIESYGRKQIAIYLWTRKEDKWKRRQKLVIHNKGEWLQIKEAVESLLPKLT